MPFPRGACACLLARPKIDIRPLSLSLSFSRSRALSIRRFLSTASSAPTLSFPRPPATPPLSRCRSSYYLLQCARRIFSLSFPLTVFQPHRQPPESVHSRFGGTVFFLSRSLFLSPLPPRFLSSASSRSRASFTAALSSSAPFSHYSFFTLIFPHPAEDLHRNFHAPVVSPAAFTFIFSFFTLARFLLSPPSPALSL